MAIGTYAQLSAAITTGWPHRTDLSADDFIQLAEAKFNRRLRTKHQELALSETAIDASYQVAIPANTLGVKRMWRTDDPKTPLGSKTLEFVIMRQSAGALALNYCQEDATWRFDGTGSVAGVLHRSIPALSSSNTTNWLLTQAPDLYLYACLAQVFHYVNNVNRAMAYEAKADQLIDELNRAEHRDQFSGPLVMRAA